MTVFKKFTNEVVLKKFLGNKYPHEAIFNPIALAKEILLIKGY